MHLAYLTTMYPSMSHTFIRRELQEMERQAGDLCRFAIRRTTWAIVEADDHDEDARTFRVLDQPLPRWAAALARTGGAHPWRSLKGLGRALRLGFRSDRGLPRHLAYFGEALLLLDEMRRRGIDHVHVHFGTNAAAVANVMRAMGGPSYSFTVHGPDELDAPVALALGRKIEDAAFVVAISDYCAAQLRRWVRWEQWDKIRVVRCAVGDDFFDEARPVDPSSRRLVCVGRLCPQKGQMLLVDGFADAVERGVDAELVLCGDGDLRDAVEERAAQRGVADRVRVTGWIESEAVRREIAAARALVLPSFAEGLPIVIMEAFAMARPVLSTYVAGIPELVRDGRNGWLIPAGSRAAIARAIGEIMATPSERLDAMGRQGRADVRELHYTPTETAKLLAHLREALGGDGAQPQWSPELGVGGVADEREAVAVAAVAAGAAPRHDRGAG